MRHLLTLILSLALTSIPASAGYETGTANQVLRVPSAGGRPQYGTVNLTSSAATTGTLPIARGGTNNGSLDVTAGGAVYSDGTKLMGTGVGVAGKVLTSHGSSAPSFDSVPAPQLTTQSKTTTYGILTTDDLVFTDATSAAFTVTLPTAVGVTGKVYYVVKTDSSTNQVTIATTSSQTIRGQTTYKLASQYGQVVVVSDGANWQVISERNNWLVDAYITSATQSVQISTSDVTDYNTGTLQDSTQQLANGANASITAQIPCSSTNAASGTTCSVGNEDIGVAFTPPTTGPVQVCVTWNQYTDDNNASSNGGVVSYQIEKTADASQTFVESGITEHMVGISVPGAADARVNSNASFCDYFNITSLSKVVFRLRYKALWSATPNSSIVITHPGDGITPSSANPGVHWTVRPSGNNH